MHRAMASAGRSSAKPPTTWPMKKDSSLSARDTPVAAAWSMWFHVSATRIGCSGIGSGSGLPGRSHSSCQALRSWRAGLPVRTRDRTVSHLLAARKFRLTSGGVMSSWLDSPTDPRHTPEVPSEPAICRPEAIPPAASHRGFVGDLDDLRGEHRGYYGAGASSRLWPVRLPAFEPLGRLSFERLSLHRSPAQPNDGLDHRPPSTLAIQLNILRSNVRN
jgi:hypothetical protein